MTHDSQRLRIQRYLAKGLPLTPLKALRLFGTLRLGARIYDLREQGVRIDSFPVRVGKKFVAEYRMVP